MKNAGQLALGLFTAIGSTVLVVSAVMLAMLEGGTAIGLVTPAAMETVTPLVVTATPAALTPKPDEVPATAIPATITPAEAAHCENTPGDWISYTVQPGDTIGLLVEKSGASSAEFLTANCFVSASMRLEPGWVVFLPPTAPTPTETPTPTPMLPTPTSCGAPTGWVNYVVKPGDTLFKLSVIYRVSIQQLMFANCLTSDQIYYGTLIRVPFYIAPTYTPTFTPTPTQAPSDTPIPTPTRTFTPVTPVVPQDQTITFGALSDQVYGSSPFMVSATASSSLPVSFSATGNCSIAGSTVTITGAGSCAVTASQPGNSSYNPAAPITQTFTIAKANQAISFGPIADKTVLDAPFGASATASSGLAVSFSASGSCTIGGGTVTLTGAGSCAITASQAGNENFNAAADVTVSFSISLASQTISFDPVPNKMVGDAPFGISATASSGLPVSFSASGGCTVAGTTVTITATEAGACTITASQGGDGSTYAPAVDAAQTFTISSP